MLQAQLAILAGMPVDLAQALLRLMHAL